MSVSGFRASRYYVLALAFAALALVVGWNRQSQGDANQSVEINFALVAGGQKVECGKQFPGIGTSKATASLHDARLYVHDVSMADASGRVVPVQLSKSQWQYAGVALLDFEDGKDGCVGDSATNMVVRGAVPKGDYISLRFSIGVPVEGRRADGATVPLNHSNVETMPAPLDVLAMGWSWQAGRKYVKLELEPQGGTAREGGSNSKIWLLHLGATGCVGNPMSGDAVSCQQPNRPKVEIDQFNAETQQVAIDLAALLADSNLSDDQGEATGCMSSETDPECAGIFAHLGLAGSGGANKGTAPVFRAIMRQ